MDNILVSAIITTYKRDFCTLSRAIDSILQQTYNDIEIIVVDDSPSDYAEREIIKKEIRIKYPDVVYIQHERNMGACIARNTGLKNSSGYFVAFLDDDDQWKCDKILKQLNAYYEDDDPESLALVTCGYEKYNASTNSSKVYLIQGKIDYLCLLKKNNIVGSTSFPLIRKKYLEEIGGFDPDMPASQDYDVWLRLAQKYRIIYVNEPLTKYYVHADEQISKNVDLKVKGWHIIIEKNKEAINKDKAIKWRMMSIEATHLASAKQMGKGIKVWLYTVYLQPLKLRANAKNLYYVFRARYLLV